MKKFFAFYLWVLFGVVFIGIPNISEAASLYIDPPFSTINRGDSITLSVRLDTDEEESECVNAVDGVITYSDNIEPVDISVGDSIFNIWVEQPKVNKSDHTITFAGGIPNGYCGRIAGDPRLTNVLTKIVFRSPGFTVGGGSSGQTEASVSFLDESTAYLNDGFGTKADLTTYGAKIELNPKAGATMENAWQDEVLADNIRPQEFSISLQKDEKAFSQKYYIVFNTIDKETGIDQYQVMEEPLTQFGSFQWGRADAPWIVSRSPYVLEDQSLNSIIRVRAIDKAGNEYIATLIPDESMRTISGPVVMVIVLSVVGLLALALIILIVVLLLRRRSKKESVENEEGVVTEE